MKQHPSVISPFCRSEVWGGRRRRKQSDWVLHSEPHKTQFKAGLGSYLATLGKKPFSGSLRLWAESTSCCCRAEVSISLLAVTGGLSHLLEVSYSSLPGLSHRPFHNIPADPFQAGSSSPRVESPSRAESLRLLSCSHQTNLSGF